MNTTKNLLLINADTLSKLEPKSEINNLDLVFKGEEIYNYEKNVYADLYNYIIDHAEEFHNLTKEEAVEVFNDENFIDDDDVSGNASGSYWYNSWKAFMCLRGNFDLMKEMTDAFGTRNIDSEEKIDVLIRMYLAFNLIGKVFTEIFEKLEASNIED